MVSGGLREKQGTSFTTQGPSMHQIVDKQIRCGLRIRNDTLPPVFGFFGLDANGPVSQVNIGDVKGAELFSPERRIIRESKHDAITNRLLLGCF
jgi:hypothetical protein